MDTLMFFKQIPTASPFSLDLFQEKEPKPDLNIKMNNDDWYVELKDTHKSKLNCLSVEIHFDKNIITFASEEPKDSKEILEWFHNFRKYIIFRSKYGNYQNLCEFEAIKFLCSKIASIHSVLIL